tara:strand:- start:279 stop:1019 length:741 start_codon:yes stop_codon:yes gene_type:complete
LDKRKIYFASDFHLGSPSLEASHKREKLIISWLNQIEKDAKAIYLVGDIFDFWFEYKKVIPKGFVRLLGKLASLSDNGIQIHIFPGNHDLWISKYLEKEVGIIIHNHLEIIEENGKKICISHGDGLGNGDYIYKFIRQIFNSKICQWLFSTLHPNLAFTIAHTWSKRSKRKQDSAFISNEKEILYNYCKKKQKTNAIDYYIFGHRHIPLEIKIDKRSKYINLGDWITHNTYAVLENGIIQLESYKE